MGRRVVALAAAAVVGLLGACGDGTSSFCTDLAAHADLDSLVAALDAGDSERAAAEARRFADLAAEAPNEVRTDLRALADAVADIVALVERDDDSEAGRETAALNQRLGDLFDRSLAVEDWALRECGIDLRGDGG